MIRLLFHMTIFCFLVGCSKGMELSAGVRAGGFKLVDENKQALVLDEMSTKEIPYVIDGEGFVRFMQKDLAEVRKIKRKVQSEGRNTQYDRESEPVMNKEYLNILKAKFDLEGIPFKIEDRGTHQSVIWEVKYADKVDQIVEDAGLELYGG